MATCLVSMSTWLKSLLTHGSNHTVSHPLNEPLCYLSTDSIVYIKARFLPGHNTVNYCTKYGVLKKEKGMASLNIIPMKSFVFQLKIWCFLEISEECCNAGSLLKLLKFIIENSPCTQTNMYAQCIVKYFFQ